MRRLIFQKYPVHLNNKSFPPVPINSTLYIRSWPRLHIFANLLTINTVKSNNQITAPELRVLDETGKNLGIMTRESALQLAREQGLDLVEVSPLAKPPVVKVISFDKFRYQQEKKVRKQRANQKGQQLKRVQISVVEAPYDLERKAKKVDEFLAAGSQVTILLVLRGREKAHKDLAKEKLGAFMKMINPNHQIIMESKFGARGIGIQVAKRWLYD